MTQKFIIFWTEFRKAYLVKPSTRKKATVMTMGGRSFVERDSQGSFTYVQGETKAVNFEGSVNQCMDRMRKIEKELAAQGMGVKGISMKCVGSQEKVAVPENS